MVVAPKKQGIQSGSSSTPRFKTKTKSARALSDRNEVNTETNLNVKTNSAREEQEDVE